MSDDGEWIEGAMLDDWRERDEAKDARISALEAALIEADALAEQCELFADGKLYSMNPVLEAREAYRRAREATR